MKVKESNGSNKSYVIEVKPKKQVTGPKKTRERQKDIWQRSWNLQRTKQNGKRRRILR